jgi:hypothetical protein
MGTPDVSHTVELERCLLRLLCNGAPGDTSVADACRELSAYNWLDQDNRVVFEALARVRNADKVPLRAQLTEHATRMGFPDIDWQIYLEPASATVVPIPPWKLKQAIELLLAAAADHR